MSPRPGREVTADHTPCFACGRLISTRRPWQGRGGKAKVRHKCPHGRWCISGSPLGGQGFNRAPIRGPHSCRDCAVIPDAERRRLFKKESR